MMNNLLTSIAAVSIAGFSLLAVAEPATTIIATPQTSQPIFAAPVISTIPVGTTIDVVERRKLWCRVKYEQAESWVRCFDLKFKNRVAYKSSTSGHGRAIVSTIGIRGLEATDLEAAQPDMEQLRQLDGYFSGAAPAEVLAGEKELSPRSVAYIGNAEADESDDEL